MNLHSLQRQLSVGAGMNRLPGHSFRNRWIIPASVAMMMALAVDRLQNLTIFSVEQISSASIRTALVHSGCATRGASGNSRRMRLMLAWGHAARQAQLSGA